MIIWHLFFYILYGYYFDKYIKNEILFFIY